MKTNYFIFILFYKKNPHWVIRSHKCPLFHVLVACLEQLRVQPYILVKASVRVINYSNKLYYACVAQLKEVANVWDS